MKEYKVIIKIESSLTTPLRSDIIFGHFCWALRYVKGEELLKKFLDSYKVSPPIIFSNGYPDGFLPRPILPPVSVENRLLPKNLNESAKFIHRQKIKYFSKQPLVPIQLLLNISDNLSQAELLQEQIKSESKYLAPEPLKIQTVHNVIDRELGSVIMGGLFAQYETFYDPDIEFAIYIKHDPNIVPEIDRSFIEEIFRDHICISGYGKKKSTGRGQIKFCKMVDSDLPHSHKSNAVMSLSHFIPDQNLPTEDGKCFYEIFSKRGVISGERWSYDLLKNLNNDNNNAFIPFKRPILMMTAGSIFILDKEPSDFYGVMLGGKDLPIHPLKSEVYHHAFLFPLRVNISENLNEIS